MSDDVVLVCLYSGMGGVEVGAKMAGIECVLSIDCWDEAVRTNALNNPGGRHVQLTFGEGAGSVENVGALILASVGKRRYHVHGSPPCQAFSLANPQERRDDEIGAEQMVWFFELLQWLKDCEHPMWSWSCEQVPPARAGMMRLHNLGECHIPAFIRKAMKQPTLIAKHFGSVQHRERLFFGEGFTPVKSAERNTIHDLLPHLKAEHEKAMADGTWEDNFSQVTGVIDEDNKAYLQQGTVCTMGAVIPGRLGSSWTGETYGRSFRYCYRLDGTITSIVHHPMCLTYVRFFTLGEQLTMAGFPSDYQFPPDVVNFDRYQMIGNAVCPLVAYGVFKGLRTSQDWWF